MSTKFTKEMVDDYADKLLIGLTEEENQMVLDEFEIIDETINTINEIEGIENVEPMTHTLDDFVYELREDEADEGVADFRIRSRQLPGNAQGKDAAL